MEQRSGKLSVFWLLNVVVFSSILGVSVVSVLPFILPSFVVGITVIPGNLVSDRDIDQSGGSEGSEREGIVEDDLLRGGLLGEKGSLGELRGRGKHFC